MAHSADAIANYFLDRAWAEGKQLTPMHVQKLTFYAHAWHLATDKQGRPLINEPVEAWRLGPVIRSLYREFADFGDRPITKKAQELDGATLELMEPSVQQENLDSGLDQPLVQAVLERVWDIYRQYTAIQLSNMSHSEGEPWTEILNRHGGRIPKAVHIPNATIRECYKRKLAK